jgi:lipopolysaccharide transport system permease protein
MSDRTLHPEVRRYTSKRELGNPVEMLQGMFADLAASRELAWRLFLRDINAQYRQSYLGYVWAFLPPLVSSLTFVLLTSLGFFKTGETGIPYSAFAMIGTMLWQVFADSIAMPLASFNQAKSMLSKINFPRESILLAGMMMVICNFFIRLGLLVLIMAYFRIVPTTTILLFPVTILALLTAGMALGLALVPLGSLFGDVNRALPMITSFWMLLTPVVYPPKTTGLAGILSSWNPASPLITSARETLTGLPVTHLGAMFLIFGASLIVLFVSWVGFRVAMPHLIARMGS